MNQVLIPPAYADITGPLIFIAGPIQGSADWQERAIAILAGADGVTIASPRRLGELRLFSEKEYNEQVDWEHFHLDRAARNGVIMFWLSKENLHRCDRPYAQTTRFELGEAVTLHRLAGAKVCVGLEEGFSNARYLRRTLAKKAPGIPLCATLEETCRRAAELARA